MSLLSFLGKIGKGAVGMLPGGGALTTALDVAGDLGGLMGSGAAASKAGRLGESDMQARMDALNNRSGLDAAEFNMGTGVTRAQQVAKGDLMSADIPQAAVTGSGRNVSFSGGIGPQMFGADTAQAGNELKRQALMALMSGSDRFTPTHSAIPQAGMLEKIGGIGGLVGGLAGVAGGMLKKRQGNGYDPNDENGVG